MSEPNVNQVVQPKSHNFLLIILSCVATFFISRYMSQQENEKYRKAIEETVTAKLQKFGESTQAKGSVVDYAEIERRVKSSLGPELSREISRNNGVIQSLTTALGEVRVQIAGLKANPPGQKNDDGSFVTTLEQNREKFPSLTSLSLKYDPKKPGLTGLQGTWNNYAENFDIAHAEWRTGHDGLRSAVTLKRTVYRDAAKTQKVGEEVIPVENADAFFPSEVVGRIAPVPKYNVFLGASFDQRTNAKRIAFYIDTKVTKQFGVTTGYVNQGYFLGTSWSFGKQ